MSEQVETPVEAQPVEPDYYGIPISCFKAFKMPIDNVSGMEVTQLRDIVDWARKNSPDNDINRTIANIQSKVGAPGINERIFEKVWNFIKMNSIVSKVIGG